MGAHLAGISEIRVRRSHHRDEARGLHSHPGSSKASCSMDDTDEPTIWLAVFYVNSIVPIDSSRNVNSIVPIERSFNS